MAILTKKELIERIKTYTGDRTDDETLSLIEDVTDTVGSEDGEDWKTKYEENDKAWRKKYKERFESGDRSQETETETETETEKETETETEKETYESLFE